MVDLHGPLGRPVAKVRLPLHLTADLISDVRPTGEGRIDIDLGRCTSDSERDRFVRILIDSGEDALLRELRGAPPVGTIQFDAKLPWILRYAREMPQDGGGTRLFLATERPISAVAIWDDPRCSDYPFTMIDLLFDRDGSVTGSLTLAARVTADREGNFLSVESFLNQPIEIAGIEIQRE